MKKEEETFAIRTYDKAELASLYCPGREPGVALAQFENLGELVKMAIFDA